MSTRWSSRDSLVRIFERYETEFTPHVALKAISAPVSSPDLHRTRQQTDTLVWMQDVISNLDFPTPVPEIDKGLGR